MKVECFKLGNLTPEIVDRFLLWLEEERNNGTATRNQRLAAIHSFVRYVQIQEPRLMLNFQKILAIPVKRTEHKAINPLSKEAVALILRQPDTSTAQGRRDATILCFLYDTAARVQETVRHQYRGCPSGASGKCADLWQGPKNTNRANSAIHGEEFEKLSGRERHLLDPEKSHLPLFTNRDGKKMSRANVTYIP